MKRSIQICAVVFISLGLISCEHEMYDMEENEESLAMRNKGDYGPFEFPGTVFDIASAPDGSIFVGLNEGQSRSVQSIKNGKVSSIMKVNSTSDINGLAPIGAGNIFLSTAGADRALEGELYRVSRGNSRMVADLAAFEREFSPDALAGPQWKNQLCEGIDGFTPGPQNNPYKVAARSGNTAIVADAAGNTVLSATTNGNIDWLAILTPPVDETGEWIVRWDTEDETGESIPCYVQPVPTAVAIGPDGYIYVGELTGTMSDEDGTFPIGLSRVWKISPDANNVVCSQTDPSADCELLIDGLTSVIDLEISPDGLLYVVEFDKSSWFASLIPGIASGGVISSYDLSGNLVEEVASNLSFPSAIAFDKIGNLWVLENNDIGISDLKPTVRVLD
ncbi:ScyD/ScyE family protein [Litoribacter populi]|uniref:ScyD/ScyE family protein n=1 Tax=Litoribacter populi TaxID=2598460 RepID=UPI00163D7EE3|nr:ScyD/ScyE family protein [Litoribacter populi]